MKKRVLSLFIVLVSFLFLGIVSATSCGIVEGVNCPEGEYKVLGLSSNTNAHGELGNQTNYDYSLCCDFGAGNTDCSTIEHPIYGIQIPQNKILGLSSITNAHAEIPSEENYEEEICYAGLSCINMTGECDSDSDYDFGILSLSGATNAHIGDYLDYSTNICCNVIECRNDANPEEIVYCENYTMEECKLNPCEGIAIEEVETFYDGIICSGENANANCDCYWVGAEEKCKPNYLPFPPKICGDQFIDETLGETCECGINKNCGDSDDDLMGETCATYGLTGDGLFCDECKTNTSLCEGASGFCGDGTINPGETCDCGGDGCSSEELLERTHTGQYLWCCRT